MKKNKQLFQITSVLLLIFLIRASIVYAAGSTQWTPANNGATIANATDGGTQVDQVESQSIKTTDGKFIVVWKDGRNFTTNNFDIYAQKLSTTNGSDLWTAGGVAVAAVSGTQPATTDKIAITSDNAGGAIIAWVDDRMATTDVYMQRIDTNGSAQWTANGVSVDIAAVNPVLLEDGSGGAYLAWEDTTAGNSEILVTHITSAGVVDTAWNTAGGGTFRPVTISSGVNNLVNPSMVANVGGTGVIISYSYTSGTTTVLSAKIDSTGSKTFENQTIQSGISGTINNKSTGDGNRGIITAYNVGTTEIHVQRQNSSGANQWGAAGTTIVTGGGTIGSFGIVDDGRDGAIVTWEDDRSAANEIYAQRLNSSGAVQWTANGITLSNTGDAFAATNPLIVSNGGYGAVISWLTNGSMVAQHITSDGSAQWTANGEAVDSSTWTDISNSMAPDNNGGAFISWEGNLDGGTSTYDLYGQYMQDSVGGLCSETGSGQLCGQQTISSQTLTFQDIPDTFNFGTITEGNLQDVFNNNTPPHANEPGTGDLLKIYDDRNSGGFTVTVDTDGTFSDGTDTIPLANLYIVTSLDETPSGGDTNTGGITYLSGFSGDQTISTPVYVDVDTLDLTTTTTYTGLGASAQFGGSPLTLMDGTLSSASGRDGAMSLFTNFYLKIEATQQDGSYSLILTYTLTDSTT